MEETTVEAGKKGNTVNFEGAVIKEQGVRFGVIAVKGHILNLSSRCDSVVEFGREVWGPIPIVLMAVDGRGLPTYKGRRDLVNFLASIDAGRIPWKRFTVRAA